MSKRPKSRTKRVATFENPASHFLTVGWMLMVITTLVCEVLSAGSHFYVTQFNRQATTVELLSGLLLFAAVVIGFVSLMICPVVLKSRRDPPPRPILAFAVIVGAAPLVALFVQAVR